MDYWHLFDKTQAVSVASLEADQPRVRPMTLICLEQRLFLATGSKDSKAKQWQRNPHLECLLTFNSEAGNGYLRVSGTVSPIQNLDLKKQIADYAPFIYTYWQDSANPDFVLYEIIPAQWRYLEPGADLELITP